MTVVVALPDLPWRAYSVTSVMAVGRQPPRPSPATNRSRPKTNVDGAKAHNSVHNENSVTEMISDFRRPMTSVMVPIASPPSIIPARPTVETTDAVPGVRPQTWSRSSTGSTEPSTTRSNPSSRTAVQARGTTQERTPGDMGNLRLCDG